MLKKTASFVLASRRGSTYSHGNRACLGRLGGAGKNVYASSRRHCRLTVSPASTDVALIMLRAMDLAAALLDGLFEHPAGALPVVSDSSCFCQGIEIGFSIAC
jgi:hypothetical protein